MAWNKFATVVRKNNEDQVSGYGNGSATMEVMCMRWAEMASHQCGSELNGSEKVWWIRAEADPQQWLRIAMCIRWTEMASHQCGSELNGSEKVLWILAVADPQQNCENYIPPPPIMRVPSVPFGGCNNPKKPLLYVLYILYSQVCHNCGPISSIYSFHNSVTFLSVKMKHKYCNWGVKFVLQLKK